MTEPKTGPRAQYPTEAILDVYVPLNFDAEPAGTAFVCRPVGEDRQIIPLYLERDEGFENIKTFEDRMGQAAGRCHERYPTSKLIGLHRDEVVKVARAGYRQGLGWVIIEMIDLEALLAWDAGPHHVGGSPERHRNRDGQLMNRLIQQGHIKPT